MRESSDPSIHWPHLSEPELKSNWKLSGQVFFPRIEHLVSNCVTEETAKWEKSLDLVHLHKVHFSPNSPPQILIVLLGFFQASNPLFGVLDPVFDYTWSRCRNLMGPRNKMFYILEIAMFGKHYYYPPKQFKDFGGNKRFYFEELRINDQIYAPSVSFWRGKTKLHP